MTRHETPFVTDGDLLVVKGLVSGPLQTAVGRFVLDTGAVFTTMTPELADLIGYSARDGINYEIRSAERRILVERIEP